MNLTATDSGSGLEAFELARPYEALLETLNFTDSEVIDWVEHIGTFSAFIMTLHSALRAYGSVNVARVLRQARQLGVCAAPAFTEMLSDDRFAAELDELSTASLAPFIADCARTPSLNRSR